MCVCAHTRVHIFMYMKAYVWTHVEVRGSPQKLEFFRPHSPDFLRQDFSLAWSLGILLFMSMPFSCC